jgi:putative MATE family efflux protein
MVLNVAIGIVITLSSLLFYQKLFSIYDLTPKVTQYAFDYFTLIAWGIPFMFVSFSLAASLRGVGDTKTPMYVVGFSNIVNIILNYVLITGYGPFPELGIKGAAIATSFSRLVAAGIYIYILLFKRKHLKIKRSLFTLRKDILSALWRLSLPGAVEQFFMQGSFLVAGIIISQLTTLEEASFRIMISIESISFMPAVGMSIATATLVGKALGEKNITKSLHTGYIATSMGLIWGIFIGSIFILFPRELLSLYTEDLSLINLSIATAIAAGVNQPFLNPMIVLTGALRGAGDTKTVMKIVTLRLWVFFIPLTYLFILPLGQGVKGLWFAETLSFVIALPLVFYRFKSKEWSKIQI